MLLNICLMTFTELFGSINIQKYAKSNSYKDLFFGILGYIGLLFFLYKSFLTGDMLWVSTMWQGMVIVFGSAFAYFYLGERFHNPLQYIGILLGLMSVVCVYYGDKLNS